MAILTLSALVGLRFLTSGMQVLNDNGLLAPEAARAQANGRASAQAVPAVPVGATPAAATPASAEPVVVPAGAAAVESPSNGAVITAPAPAPVPQQSTGQSDGTSFPPGVPQPGYQRQWVERPARPGASAQRPASMNLLYIWILLFGFVGTQLGWTLRPFFGDPGQDFSFFRSIDGNFYAEIVRTISNL